MGPDPERDAPSVERSVQGTPRGVSWPGLKRGRMPEEEDAQASVGVSTTLCRTREHNVPTGVDVRHRTAPVGRRADTAAVLRLVFTPTRPRRHRLARGAFPAL
jgi:hypothetical protein